MLALQRRAAVLVGCALPIVLTLAFTANAVGAERVALVIGNSSYPTGALENPANDARDVAELLKQAGFQVDLRLDTTKVQLLESLQNFGQTLKGKQTKFGVFYYAGHGAQQSWHNYLIPIDANVQSGDDVSIMAIDVSELTVEMARTRDRNFLMILDACRDDPFGTAYRPPAKGLTQYDAPAGSLLAYATGPGRVASDGSGRNGLYTTFLLREFSVKGARIEDAFKRVRLGVRLASRGRQIPWESTSLEDDLYIFPPINQVNLSDADRERLLDQEIDAWRSAKSANSIEALAAFMREYPSGNVSELAQSRLNAMLRADAPRPRLARLHTPDEPRLALPEKTLLAAASPPVLRAIEEASPQTLVNPIAARPSEPAIAANIRPLQTLDESAASAAPAPGSAANPSGLGTATSVASIAPAQSATAAQLAPTAPIQIPSSPVQATALPQVVAEAPQNLTVAPTPMYAGSYENVRHYRVGDVFRYQVINRFNGIATPLEMRVTALDPQKEEVTYNGGEFVSDTMGNVVRNLRGTMDSPRQFYPAELYVGKKWTTMFRQARERGTFNTFKYQLKVVGKETVVVPAGRFEAYKIEARGFNLERRGTIERDIWLSPGVDADIIHETKVRTASGMIEQYDRQELVELPKR